MSNVSKLVKELRDGLEGVSIGPWDIDDLKNDGDYGSGPDCNSGFDSYALYDGNGKIITDTLNNEVAEVHEDWPDEDGYAHAWDEQAKKDISHIARCSPDSIRALLDSHDAVVEALGNMIDLVSVGGFSVEHFNSATTTLKAAKGEDHE